MRHLVVVVVVGVGVGEGGWGGAEGRADGNEAGSGVVTGYIAWRHGLHCKPPAHQATTPKE